MPDSFEPGALMPSASIRARGPDDPQHPDHEMLEQIRAGVRRLDESVGKPYDETSELISRSLLASCKDNRDRYPDKPDYSLAGNALNRVDHVVMGTTGNVFAVEGRLGYPASKRAWMSAEQASRTSVEQSDEKLQLANQMLSQERTAQQQDLAQGLGEAARKAPIIS